MKYMNKDIEIEIRGPLSKDKFDGLKKIFVDEGKFIIKKDRLFLDYSTFLEGEGIRDRKRDIRLKVTNGIPEIVVKLGDWGGTEQRKEFSVATKPGEFDNLVQIFAALGFNKAVLCIRKIMVYEYKGIEFALVEVPGHSYYYEAEKMANNKENGDKLIDEIKKVCLQLNLEIFDKEKWFNYVDKLNQEVNEIFEYTKYIPGYFKKRFGL